MREIIVSFSGVKIMVTVTKTTPRQFFAFLDIISAFQPCSIEQIRKSMKSVWGPVYSTRNFALQYKFISFDEKGKTFSLAQDGERLLRYSGNLRYEFLINNFKLQCCEPFSSLQNELSKRRKMTISEIGDFLETKFSQKAKWKSSEKEEFGKAITQWLVLLRVAEVKDATVTYVKGEVKTAGIIYFPEMTRLLDRALYDFLTENFNTPHNIIHEPYELLEKTNKASDDNDRGDLFELFIASVFKRFGFSPRLRDGFREQKANLTYQRKGGGDVGLFCHFPTQARTEILEGYAIACEGKAKENVIGSKAVGQARNLCTKIKEFYPKYLVHTAVISQSTSGYDSSGREQAPPEVLHITSKVLLSLLDLQEKRLEKGSPLINPIHIMLLFEELIKRQSLEPNEESALGTLKEILKE